MARLGDVCEKVTDYVASGSFAALKENVLITNEEDYAIMVKTADFSNGFTKGLTYTNKHGYDFLRNSNLFGGELILSNIGSIGKVFKVPYLDRPMTLASNTVMIKTTTPELTDYLYYYFLSPAGYKNLLSISSGTSMLKFNKTELKKLEVPVPDIDKQRHIIAVMDKVSELIALRKEQLAKQDQLVKSRFIELFGDPQSNPCGYQYAKLSDIATYYNGLTYKPENVAEEGTIVLRSSNIQNSQLDFADTVRVDCAVKERLMVQENDILMCSRNGSAKLVGKVALIKGIQEPMSFGAFMMIIRSQYFGYLMTYFQMDAFRQQIKTGATTTINQITGRMLDDVTIPLPPLVLVDQFTAFVEQTDKSKLAIQQSLDKLELLKKSLMQEYFG